MGGLLVWSSEGKKFAHVPRLKTGYATIPSLKWNSLHRYPRDVSIRYNVIFTICYNSKPFSTKIIFSRTVLPLEQLASPRREHGSIYLTTHFLSTETARGEMATTPAPSIGKPTAASKS
jgi:hypothetical protein